MANVQLNPGTGGPLIATNSITRDNATEEMELINFADPNSGACAPVDSVNGVAVQVKTLPGSPAQEGTDATGVSPLAGGVGSRGWLSSIFSKLSNTLNVALTNAIGKNSSGTGQWLDLADSSVPINASANATLVVGVAGKVIKVTHFDWIANGTGTVNFEYGAGPTNIAGPYNVQPQVGLSVGTGAGTLFTVPAGQDLKIITNVAVGGLLSYYQA